MTDRAAIAALIGYSRSAKAFLEIDAEYPSSSDLVQVPKDWLRGLLEYSEKADRALDGLE